MDKTQENLARIRACDAEWNENDHPRSNNGQFTSGGGGGAQAANSFAEGLRKVTASIKSNWDDNPFEGATYTVAEWQEIQREIEQNIKAFTKQVKLWKKSSNKKMLTLTQETLENNKKSLKYIKELFAQMGEKEERKGV